tara:strand:+ start:638 stop:796 length:159 start_codon:yes stop_codon:yes gene_type:complete
MDFAPNANWELIGYIGIWLVLTLSSLGMLEYFENKSKAKKNKKVRGHKNENL